ncbi:hypothetical protein CMV16_11410 [Peribacillus simplex]|nr:hypothetical protein CMV16_11410 [Peribacillus simplex]
MKVLIGTILLSISLLFWSFSNFDNYLPSKEFIFVHTIVSIVAILILLSSLIQYIKNQTN